MSAFGRDVTFMEDCHDVRSLLAETGRGAAIFCAISLHKDSLSVSLLDSWLSRLSSRGVESLLDGDDSHDMSSAASDNALLAKGWSKGVLSAGC